ncbi:hypothetical protein [Paenibacillus piri]|nr:hypothetical protein [Paenibacillus piri]
MEAINEIGSLNPNDGEPEPDILSLTAMRFGDKLTITFFILVVW